jgi:hypothetical protein
MKRLDNRNSNYMYVGQPAAQEKQQATPTAKICSYVADCSLAI